MIYHTYVDWTTEECPRAFYVGKGNEYRTRKPERNQKHKHVRKTFGHRREIIFSSNDENACLQKEIDLIQEYHTYYLDELADKAVACNFTLGGDGSSGYKFTEYQKENISAGLKKKFQDNPDYAKGIAERAKIRMNNPEFVSSISKKIKASLASIPEEKKKIMYQKIADANRGRTSHILGEKNWRTTLSNDLVRQIKIEFADLSASNKKTKVVKILCEKYNQGYNTIYKIVSGITWKHIEV
jgi:hypothetical protein